MTTEKNATQAYQRLLILQSLINIFLDRENTVESMHLTWKNNKLNTIEKEN